MTDRSPRQTVRRVAAAVQANPVVSLLREVIRQWQEDRAVAHGAALAYYTIFSLAPLLLLVIAIVGLVFGRKAAQGQLMGQIQGMMGPDGARMIEGMIAKASRPASGIVATAMSLATMLLGASGVFGQLQSSLNLILRAPPSRRSGMRGAVRQRAATFGLVLAMGGLLLVSVALSAVVTALHGLIAQHLPFVSVVIPPLNLALSFLVATALFALLYKALPQANLAWRDVWLGAGVTSILFALGKGGIGLYLGRAGSHSVYGAAGSLVIVLLWVYYSAQILFLGAEFTEVWSRRYGSRRVPS